MEFPKGLKELKARILIKLKWNTLFTIVVQDILCLAWQDNNIVLTLSNIHIVDKVEDFQEKARNRPIKILTNRRIIRKVFRSEHTKNLQIPYFINNYNHYIGGINLINQFREAYETYKPIFRTWQPLFYQLINIAYVNAYRLY